MNHFQKVYSILVYIPHYIHCFNKEDESTCDPNCFNIDRKYYAYITVDDGPAPIYGCTM